MQSAMNYPKIGTVWLHKKFINEYITIVDSSASCCPSRKNIAYEYHQRPGHIGGCNSCEWFYDEWVLQSPDKVTLKI